MKRLEYIDALRGFAVLLVLASHLSIELIPAARILSQTVVDLGQMGVIVFFGVSGYVIPLSLQRAPSARAFLWGRVWRLFPLYWLALAGALLCVALGAEVQFTRESMRAILLADPVRVLLSNVLMAAPLAGSPWLIASAWTLGVEALWYGLYALLWRLGGVRLLPWAALVLLLLATVADGETARTPYYLAIMATAASVHALPRRAWLGLGLALLLVTLQSTGWAPFIVARLAGVLVFVLGTLRAPRRVPGALVWIGKISYSLYLLHTLVAALLPPVLWPLLVPLSITSERYIERGGVTIGRWLVQSVERKRRPGNKVAGWRRQGDTRNGAG